MLASDVDGANETIRFPIAGALVPIRDPAALVRAAQTRSRAQRRAFATVRAMGPPCVMALRKAPANPSRSLTGRA